MAGRHAPLRLVRQKLWALLLTHYAELSFVRTLNAVAARRDFPFTA